jgi:hypothetical protein
MKIKIKLPFNGPPMMTVEGVAGKKCLKVGQDIRELLGLESHDLRTTWEFHLPEEEEVVSHVIK